MTPSPPVIAGQAPTTGLAASTGPPRPQLRVRP
jgi:hypothetical protein